MNKNCFKLLSVLCFASGLLSFSAQPILADDTARTEVAETESPFAHIKELGASVVEAEFVVFQATSAQKIQGQSGRMGELNKALNRENVALRSLHLDENRKQLEDRDNAKDVLEKSLSRKRESEKVKVRREWNLDMAGKRGEAQKKQLNDKWFLAGRQTLERSMMQKLFELERNKGTLEKQDRDSYLKKHSDADVLIHIGQGRKLEEIVVLEEKKPEILFRWGGYGWDMVGKKQDPAAGLGGPDGEADGIFEVILTSPVADMMLMTADEKGDPCCGNQWNSPFTHSVKPPEALEPDMNKTSDLKWEQKLVTKDDVEAKKSEEAVPQSVKWMGRIHVADRGAFHKGQKFVLFVVRPAVEAANQQKIDKVVCTIEEEPVTPAPKPETPTEKKSPSSKSFKIKAVCEERKGSIGGDTSWDPPSIEVNMGDDVRLSVEGPDAGTPCYSASFSMPDYGILLPKITRTGDGSMRFVSFKADQEGKFTYVDSERETDASGPIAGRTVPGTFLVRKALR